MILTVNIHPTAIKVARSGQGGRNVSLEMTDATGHSVASIFLENAGDAGHLVSAAVDALSMLVETETDHAIAADLDGQAASALPDTEPEPGRDSYSRFYKLVDSDGYDVEAGGFRRFTRSEARQHEADGQGRAVPCRAIDLASIGYADLTEAADRILHGEPADVDEQIRRDGEALGRRIAADEGLEPEQLWVVVNVEPDGRRVTVSDPRPKHLAEQWVKHEARFYPGTLEVALAGPDDLDDARQLSAVDDEDGEQR